MPTKETTAPKGPAATPGVFAAIAGLFFFITIIKLGNPVILNRYIEAPRDLASAFYYSWPPWWGTFMFVPVALAGLFAIQWNRAECHWVLMLPLIWLGWEFISATQTINAALSKLTLAHFAVGVGFFYLGFFARKGMSNPWPLWAGMALALCWAMRAGLEQHFGGLEATRKMIASSPDMAGVDPKWRLDPEYIARLNDNRIFGTFGNPNTLAGGIVLLMPLTLVFLWRLTPKVRDSIRVLFVLILGGCGLGCLYWTRSKAGWLVALAVGLVALGHSALPLKWRRWLICGMLIGGVAGFAYKYADYFHKERNSLGARLAYWRAALIVTDRNPVFGTGPGTFQIPYEKIKSPGDEMARLCHNDYLEQATDSGIPGFAIYVVMILALLGSLYRYSANKIPFDWLDFAIWLGIFGLSLHSLVDFHLYVAALAWPMFFLCGWLMKHNR
jgi:O-antigen ligase